MMTTKSEQKKPHKKVHASALEANPQASATKTAFDTFGRQQPSPPSTVSVTEFSREELRTISREVAEMFPIPTETTELVLMDVDPHHVHAYWNITPEDLAAARTNADHLANESNLVLRFHDTSSSLPGGAPPQQSFDVPVQGLENHWHVELSHDAKSYVAELGLRLQDGRLVPLARSKSIQMPQAGTAQPFGAPELASEPVEFPGRPTVSHLSPDPGVLPPDKRAWARVFPNVSAGDTHAADLGPRADEIPSLSTDPLFTSGDQTGATPHASPVRAHGPVLTGTPHGSEGAGGTYAPVETYSSSSLTHPLSLELSAELSLYGRGIPGDRLQLFGQQILVGPDGRFSLQRPLEGLAEILTFFSPKSGDRGAQGGDA